MVGSAGAGAADPDPDDLCAHPGVDRALELLDEARDVDLLQKVQSLKRQAWRTTIEILPRRRRRKYHFRGLV